MILSDTEILKQVNKGNIFIDKFNENNLGSNSYDVTLNEKLAVYIHKRLDVDSVYSDNDLREIIIPETGLILEPGELYLGLTNEIVGTEKYVPILEGRSSMARLGLTVHLSAGYGDAGFTGRWVLEITVEKPLRIKPNIRIAQIGFIKIKGKVKNLYKNKKGAHYNNQYKILPKK